MSKLDIRAVMWTALALTNIGLQAQTVEIVHVISRPVERKVDLPGEFLPYERVAIYAKVPGFVDKVLVDRGSVVKVGQLLATMVAPELTAKIAEAEAKVQAVESQRAEAEARTVATQSTYERMKAASATPGVIAGNELIQFEKQVDVERARVRAAESSITAARAAVKAEEDIKAYLRITAPVDGVITERNVHPGALVGTANSTEPMLQLESENRLRLVVAVPETDVGGIVRGGRVPFTVPAYPGETFTGTISRLAHSVDPKTRSMAVELDVVSKNGHLVPGMYPTVNWPVRRNRPSLLVPPSAVASNSERTFVIRVQNGAAEWVNVRRGAPVGDLIEVYGPLEADDVVVRRGTEEIRPGARLNVRNAPAAKG
jgi:membrane fusion protein (multidrug efflux system)